jgi:uncharacterized protein YtpQ (UPF0354 family)
MRIRRTRFRIVAPLLLLLAIGAAIGYLRRASRSAFAATRDRLRLQATEVARKLCPGVTVTFAADPGSLDLMEGKTKGTWSMDNLAKEVETEHLDEPEVERRLSQTAKTLCDALHASGDEPKTWSTARPLLRPLLVPTAYAENHHLVSRPFLRGVVVVCALDFPEHTLYVLPDRLAAWSVDETEVFAAAVDNLTRAVGSAPAIDASAPTDPSQPGKFVAIDDTDGYAAARILVTPIREQIARALGDPFYVAVPNRGFLVAWSRDYAYAKPFTAKVREDFTSRPYPISPDVFLLRADGDAGE